MIRTMLLYGGAMAVTAFGLQWLEYQFFVRALSWEIYIFLIAVFFTALGLWAGHRLTARSEPKAFEKNAQAIEYLGISDREYEVLELLGRGLSNREIADGLFVSPNTVKTHLSNLYGKLEVSRRAQAVNKAKELSLIE